MLKKSSYPYIALGIGLCLLLIVLKGSEVRSDGVPVIPLLTLLVISEFAFFATAIGAQAWGQALQLTFFLHANPY